MNNFYVEKLEENLPYAIPSTFIEGERIYIKLPLANGDTILALGDTGGGNSMMLPATVKKKNLSAKISTGPYLPNCIPS